KRVQRVVATVALSAGLLLAAGMFVAGADEVLPANVVMTNFTDVSSIEFASGATYIQGDTLSLSNSVMYTGANTNSPVQNLEGCTITTVAGNDTVAVTNFGNAISTNAGTYTASFTIPAVDPCYIEVSVSNVNERTYGRWKVRTQAPLGQ
ncbi:MAG: hypothetical protein HQ559_13035, partial [Lentisphaerae bacterium]|nr:hypothetical protein [Lentisphaerota bacterium]